jgi:ATP-dependent DNA helicase RecG
MEDFAVLEQARDDAAALVSREDFWSSPTYSRLRDYLQREARLQGEPLD